MLRGIAEVTLSHDCGATLFTHARVSAMNYGRSDLRIVGGYARQHLSRCGALQPGHGLLRYSCSLCRSRNAIIDVASTSVTEWGVKSREYRRYRHSTCREYSSILGAVSPSLGSSFEQARREKDLPVSYLIDDHLAG